MNPEKIPTLSAPPIHYRKSTYSYTPTKDDEGKSKPERFFGESIGEMERYRKKKPQTRPAWLASRLNDQHQERELSEKVASSSPIVSPIISPLHSPKSSSKSGNVDEIPKLNLNVKKAFAPKQLQKVKDEDRHWERRDSTTRSRSQSGNIQIGRRESSSSDLPIIRRESEEDSSLEVIEYNITGREEDALEEQISKGLHLLALSPPEEDEHSERKNESTSKPSSPRSHDSSSSSPSNETSGIEMISPSTQAKVYATKHFLSEYYFGLFQYLSDRKNRLQLLEESLDKANTSFFEKAAQKNALFIKESNELRERRTRLFLKDFQTLARIGKGGYGNVFLVRHKKTGAVYAMKRMNKNQLREKNSASRIMTERDVLQQTTDNPWLVQGYYSFQDSEHLYLVMEYVQGGDFRTLISTMGGFPENDAKFYIVEMIYAVNTLHEMGYIHRDLKPANFLIGVDGHLKLADFGLSKKGLKELYRSTMNLSAIQSRNTMNRRKSIFVARTMVQQRRELAYSVVGSPNYMAYELLSGEGYSFSVDWWSIGSILFELLTGVPPFFGETPMEVFENIMNYKTCLDDVQKELEEEGFRLSKACWNLIRSLLCEPEQRLGSGGVEEIFQHEFFADINWRNIRSVTPPFLPRLQSDEDFSYFDCEDDEEEHEEENLPMTPGEIYKKQKEKESVYEGFTFKREKSSKKPSIFQVLGSTSGDES